MTDFDPLRAQGLADVHKVVAARTRDAERALAEAEADSNALMKTERSAAQAVEEAREKLKVLEQEAERAVGITGGNQ